MPSNKPDQPNPHEQQASHDYSFDEPAFQELADALADPRIAQFCAPNEPLTMQRLAEIDASLPNAETIAAVARDFAWPDNDTKVAVLGDDEPYYDDPQSFGERLAHDRATYNNFPVILRAKPNQPNDGESLFDFMNRDPLYAYSSKPYLHRAHAVAPEIMASLQVIIQDGRAMHEWVNCLYQAVVEAQPDPKDEVLLQASKAAYNLCINAMRTDDLQIQYQKLGLSSDSPITDPTTELRT